jgi:hypothetical protein
VFRQRPRAVGLVINRECSVLRDCQGLPGQRRTASCIDHGPKHSQPLTYSHSRLSGAAPAPGSGGQRVSLPWPLTAAYSPTEGDEWFKTLRTR